MPDVLKNKQTKNYDSLSRYQSFPIYYHTKDNRYVYGLTSHLRGDIPYKIHEVKHPTEDFDYIAYLYYNNPTYYWIICDFNREQDPFRQLKVGEKIKVPQFSNIEFI